MVLVCGVARHGMARLWMLVVECSDISRVSGVRLPYTVYCTITLI